jgi:hypothetical protein
MQPLIQFDAVEANRAIGPAVIFAVFLPVSIDTGNGYSRRRDGQLRHAAA